MPADGSYPPPTPTSPRAPAAVLGGLRAAIMLLTRLPVGRTDTSAEARRWAGGWFPLVGTVLGAAAAGIDLALVGPLGGWLAAVVVVGFSAWITGALHEDGLADSADALGGARDRAQLFAILKDSRHGTYGVLALCLGTLFRVGAIERLGGWAPEALIVAGLYSRSAVAVLLTTMRYVTPAEGARSSDVAQAGPSQLLLAMVLVSLGTVLLALSHLVAPGTLGTAAATVALLTAICAWRFHVRAGGITGDFLGATSQVTELAVLGVFVAVLS